MTRPKPKTELNRKAAYLRWLKKTGGARKRSADLAGIMPGTVQQWRSMDKDFAKKERMIRAGIKQQLRASVDSILNAKNEDGTPKYPSHVMSAASKQLEEFAPPAQTVSVDGRIKHDHMHELDLNRLPEKMLERFIKTGEWTIEMDRIAEGTYGAIEKE